MPITLARFFVSGKRYLYRKSILKRSLASVAVAGAVVALGLPLTSQQEN
jgi:hypothetical protein